MEPLSATALVTTFLLGVRSATRLPEWRLEQTVATNVIDPEKTLLMPFTSVGSGTASFNLLHVSEPTSLDVRGAIVERLDRWAQLSDDWDGAGTRKPSPTAITAAKTLINVLPADIPIPKPMIDSGEGVVGFFWDNNEYYSDIEFDDEGKYSVFFRNKISNKEKLVEALTLSDADLSKLYEIMGSTEAEQFAA